MNNYDQQKASEKVLGKKQLLVHEAINEKKLSQHEIISRMFNALVEEIEAIKKCLFEDLKVTNKSKEKAEKISKICFTLQTCLDMENGQQIAEDLNFLYRFIRYMTKRLQDNDDMSYVNPAYQVATDIRDAWDQIPSEVRN
tara:strand:- start:494 stop:916 length:423 start_codon:yes stop_codon:yes gene_type:complete